MNASKKAGGAVAAGVARDIAARAARLAVLSDKQAQYDAEQGEMKLMRLWLAKAAKMRALAETHAKLVQGAAVQVHGAKGGHLAHERGDGLFVVEPGQLLSGVG